MYTKWIKFFSSPAAQEDAMVARLATTIAANSRTEDSLDCRLRFLAETVAGLPVLTGAMIVTCDGDGLPLNYSTHNLRVRDGVIALDELNTIKTRLSEENWTAVPGNGIEAPGASIVRGRRIVDGNETLGMLLVGLSDVAESSPIFEGLGRIQDHVKWAIQNGIYREEMALTKNLWKLELEHFGRFEPINPQKIADRLKEIFDADTATIFFREQNKLYLSVTTDLSNKPERVDKISSYDTNSGFVRLVFDTGASIRLRDARNVDEILHLYPEIGERDEVQHLKESTRTYGGPPRFLAVPMRSGLKTQEKDRELKIRGVVQILRSEKKRPFSLAEQKALQHFADILAIAMQSAWLIYMADAVLKADTEAICITRNEPGKGHSVPRIAYADRGSEKIFGLNNILIDEDARELYADGEYEKIRVLLDNAIACGEKTVDTTRTRIKRFNGSKDSGFEIRSADISYRLLTSPFVQPATQYTIAVIRDTTHDQIQAERHARLVKLLDKKGLAYFRADENSHTVETSPTEYRLTGYSFNELKGMHRSGLYEEPFNQPGVVQQMVARDGELVHVMQRLKRRDGTSFVAEGFTHLLKDENGQRLGYEGLYEDVTDRLRLQGFIDADTQEVLREQDLYKKLEESVGFHLLFMTSVSHQLRSPLGGLVEELLNYQDGIVDSTNFSDSIKYLIGQAKICALLVENMTYMDKILKGESFEFNKTNLARLAVETRLNFVHLAADRQLKIDVDNKSIGRHLDVLGHQELLRQVLVNLVDNAIKYSFPKSKIRLCGRHDHQGPYFQISNFGIPVPREDRERLFERGFRGREATAWAPGGTGLGLWLVQKIVKIHGASIRCTEILEDGNDRTAFQIFFPSSGRSRT